MSIRIIAGLTIREAVRRKVILGLLLLSVVFLVLYALGLTFIQGEILRFGQSSSRPIPLSSAYNFLLIAGLYAANFLIVMLSVLVSVDTLAGEISSGTIQAIAVKPLRRRDILLGKWVGFVIILGIFTLLLSGGVIVLTRLITGYAPPNPSSGLGLMFLESLVLLSMSLWGGTRLSTLANGVLGFGLFGLAFIGGFIEQIGGFINSDTAVSIGHIASLIMPSDVLWRLALSQMAEGLNPFRLMFGGVSAPDSGVVVYALAFAVVILVLAMRSFQRRDL